MKFHNPFRDVHIDRPLRDLEGGTNVAEQYENYITDHIRSFYRKRMISPAIFLVFLVILHLLYPIHSMMFPTVLHGDVTTSMLDRHDGEYVSIQFDDLYFTGYTKTFLGFTQGYYYYTMIDDSCVIVLLSPGTSEQGLPEITDLRIRSKIKEPESDITTLIGNLAADLSWSSEGLYDSLYTRVLSEPEATGFETILLTFLIIAMGLYAILALVLDLIYSTWPIISPPVRRLGAYGSARKLFALAEEEIITVPQLATEDMFITEHFFIETSSYGVALVPIDEIQWIYKYSTLHKFLWHHFSISYTLYITASHRQTIHCPRNIKSDIDGIMDYLSEANHDILVGFTEENRLEVEKRQGDSGPMQHIWKLLSRFYV